MVVVPKWFVMSEGFWGWCGCLALFHSAISAIEFHYHPVAMAEEEKPPVSESIEDNKDDKKRTIDKVDDSVEDSVEDGAEKKPEETVKNDGETSEKPEKKHKKRRRRQYEDEVPKEKSEDEAEDEEDEDDDGDDINDELADLDDEDDDDLAEIDPANIIPSGRRTRGKVIDFTKAAEKLKEEGKIEDDEGEDGEYGEK